MAVGATASDSTVAGQLAPTAPDGTSSIGDPRWGSYVVRVDAPGYGTATQEVMLTSASVETVEIPLHPIPGSLSGRVTNAASGAPIEGADVAVAGWHAVTDADGRYRVASLPPGAYTVKVRLDGYHTEHWPLTVGPADNHNLDLVLTPLGNTMRVRVVDAVTGRPIEGAMISYVSTVTSGPEDLEPCADYALLVPLKRSRQYGVLRPRVADLRPADAWQQDGLHFFVFELRPDDGDGNPPEAPVAVFAMRADMREPISAVVVTPRADADPEVTPVEVPDTA